MSHQPGEIWAVAVGQLQAVVELLDPIEGDDPGAERWYLEVSNTDGVHYSADDTNGVPLTGPHQTLSSARKDGLLVIVALAKESGVPISSRGHELRWRRVDTLNGSEHAA